MILKFYIINCFGYQNESNGYDLLMFAFGSFVIISMLLFYYSKLPKSNHLITELDNPIYQTKDILLQSNSNDINFSFTEKTTSTWVKILAFIIIIFIATTPFQEFLKL